MPGPGSNPRRHAVRRGHPAPQPFAIGRPPADSVLYFDGSRSGWTVWVPCHRCGGAELPLVNPIKLRSSDETLSRVCADVASLGCPSCYALDRRTSGLTEPEVWFDPPLRDWVVLAPDGHGGGAILPLGIGWFDAPMSIVMRAAADIVYADDAFLDDH